MNIRVLVLQPGVRRGSKELAFPVKFHVGCLGVLHALAIVLCPCTSVGATASNQSSGEALYATAYTVGVGYHLFELDSQTGVLVRQIPQVNDADGRTRLACDGTRLQSLGVHAAVGNRLIRIHPGDGAVVHSPPLGVNWNLRAIDFNPTTGLLTGIIEDVQALPGRCCEIDPLTAALSIGVPIPMGLNGITALAVNPAGVVLVAKTPGPRVYRLDTSNGALTYLGDMLKPTCAARDLAFDSAGALWASLEDLVSGADTGLYRIDQFSYQAVQVLATATAYTGIAFGPSTATQSFCVPKSSSIGCSPTLSGDGFASPTASLGFTLTATNLNNNRAGLLLYSTHGRAAIPFQGGLLCVQPPVQRSPAGSTGGTPLPTLDCSGSWSIDYNAMIWGKFPNTTSDPALLPPLLTPGTSVQCQWWGRDPGFPAPNNSMLSDGLEFVLAP